MFYMKKFKVLFVVKFTENIKIIYKGGGSNGFWRKIKEA